jgi:hypothetical protein
MSWRAQSRSEGKKTLSVGRGMSDKPEPGLWPVQPYGEVGYIPHPQSPQEMPGSSEQDRQLRGLCIPRSLPRWHNPDPFGGLSPAYIPEILKGRRGGASARAEEAEELHGYHPLPW